MNSCTSEGASLLVPACKDCHHRDLHTVPSTKKRGGNYHSSNPSQNTKSTYLQQEIGLTNMFNSGPEHLPFRKRGPFNENLVYPPGRYNQPMVSGGEPIGGLGGVVLAFRRAGRWERISRTRLPGALGPFLWGPQGAPQGRAGVEITLPWPGPVPRPPPLGPCGPSMGHSEALSLPVDELPLFVPWGPEPRPCPCPCPVRFLPLFRTPPFGPRGSGRAWTTDKAGPEDVSGSVAASLCVRTLCPTRARSLPLFVPQTPLGEGVRHSAMVWGLQQQRHRTFEVDRLPRPRGHFRWRQTTRMLMMQRRSAGDLWACACAQRTWSRHGAVPHHT